MSPLIGGLVLDWLGGPALYFGSFLLCILVVCCYRISGGLRRPDFSQLAKTTAAEPELKR
jgi:hypothetical protein